MTIPGGLNMMCLSQDDELLAGNNFTLFSSVQVGVTKISNTQFSTAGGGSGLFFGPVVQGGTYSGSVTASCAFGNFTINTADQGTVSLPTTRTALRTGNGTFSFTAGASSRYLYFRNDQATTTTVSYISLKRTA